MEHSMRRTDKYTVESGTQAGIHVPVCDLESIAVVFLPLSRALDV